jgi:MHS family proline/betaine transporter-like MFS transporter
VSVATFGGTAPFLATYLIATTGNKLAPALYVMSAALLTLVAVMLIRETAGAPLRST